MWLSVNVVIYTLDGCLIFTPSIFLDNPLDVYNSREIP